MLLGSVILASEKKELEKKIDDYVPTEEEIQNAISTDFFGWNTVDYVDKILTLEYWIKTDYKRIINLEASIKSFENALKLKEESHKLEIKSEKIGKLKAGLIGGGVGAGLTLTVVILLRLAITGAI